MKKFSVLLLSLFALTACNDTIEPDITPIAPQDVAMETPETRIVSPTIPESHKIYIRTVFRSALPSKVTETQVDAVVNGYLLEYDKHKGIGYVTENFHIHGLHQGSNIWPGSNEGYALQMRAYFSENVVKFINSSTRDYKYLGMALHPIYDVYDQQMYQSCAASTPGSAIFSGLGEWFWDSQIAGMSNGYGGGKRDSAISYLFGKIDVLKNPIGTRHGNDLFNNWAATFANSNVIYEPCIAPGY